MPEKMPEVPEVRPDRRDGSDFEDAAESVVNAPTPVARGPFPPMPDDTTEHDETTEEETQSSGDTKPVDIPAHAKIFAIPDAEVRGWIAQDGERLQAWCEYAAAEESVRSPGGLVRTAMRIAGNMPPAGGRTLDLAADSKAWAAALKNSAYADFIET